MSRRILSRLKYQRMKAGMLQWDLSKLTGLSESHLSRIENMRVSVSDSYLQRIANALGVNLEDVKGEYVAQAFEASDAPG